MEKKGRRKRRGFTGQARRYLAATMVCLLVGTTVGNPEFGLGTVRAEEDSRQKSQSETVITSWEWIDDWKAITRDGTTGLYYLDMPGVSADNPISREELISMLPEKILATVEVEKQVTTASDSDANSEKQAATASDSDADASDKDGENPASTATDSDADTDIDEDEDEPDEILLINDLAPEQSADQTVEITLEGWENDSFVPDEESGTYPVSGTHTFRAELPEGYVLGTNVAEPELTVVIGDGLTAEEQALLAADPETLSLVDQLRQRELLARLNGGISMMALGDENTPFVISNASQLAELAELVNAGNADFNSASYQMTADIDLSDYDNWVPIGTITTRFFGNFSGNGYVIRNLTIKSNTNSIGTYGLFGYINNSTVENLCLTNANIYGVTGGVVGGVAGQMDSSTVRCCYVSGEINVGQSASAGGVVGRMDSGDLMDCYSTAAVTGQYQVGGVAGMMYVSGTIKNCYSTGMIHRTENGTGGVGGILGYFFESGSMTITNCAALNQSVTSTDNSSASAVAGGGTGQVTGSYYWSGMSVNDSTPGSITGATSLTYDSNTSLSVQFKDIFENSDAWTFTENGLPTLNNVGGEQSSTLPAWITSSSSDTTYISTADQLADFAAQVNGTGAYSSSAKNYVGKIVMLTADIDLSNIDSWTPIGTYTNDGDNKPFKGTFDGNGYVIRNLKVTSDADYQGLFGYVNGGTIQNLGVVNVAVSGKSDIGGIVGWAADNSKIESCYVSGSISGSSNYIGGVVGQLVVSSVSNCYSTAAVSGPQNTGGVVGIMNCQSGSCTVENCYATGPVSSSSTAIGIGGVVGGLNNGTTNANTIENCVALNASCVAPDKIQSSALDSIGAVLGVLGTTATVNDNYYWSGMTITVKDVPVEPIDKSRITALTCANGTLSTQFSVVFGRDNSAWAFTENGLPTLKNAGGEQSSALPQWITDSSEAELYISSAAELAAFRDAVNGGKDYSGRTVVLAADIDLSGVNWTPIGTYTNDENNKPFKGTFDGNGYVIKNLTVNRTEDYCGLFGYVENGTIKNLGLVDVNIQCSGGRNFAGGVAGRLISGTISDCYVTGKVTGTGAYTGGVVGQLDSGEVIFCYSTAEVKGGSGVGGVVGYVRTGSTASVQNCIALNSSVKYSDGNNGVVVGGVWDSRGVTITGNAYWSGMTIYDDSDPVVPRNNYGSVPLYLNDGILTAVSGTFTWPGFDTDNVWTIPDDALALPYLAGTDHRPALSLAYTTVPAFVVDYAKETLLGGIAGRTYAISGTNVTTNTGTADANGSLAIATDWFGKTITISYNDKSQKLAVDLRPTAPTGLQGVNETYAGDSDGQITGLTAGTVYQISSDGGNTWTDKTATSEGKITGLSPTTYRVRIKAIDGSFASESAFVTISSGETRTYNLSISAPTFDPVTYGYDQPEAKAITITSSGNSAATITSVKLSGTAADSFILNKADGTVISPGAADDMTYTIRPVSGLAVGTYTATITVGYAGGATATAAATFQVTAVPEIPLTGTVTLSVPVFTTLEAGYTQTTAQKITVTNGTNKTITVTDVTLGGLDPDRFILSEIADLSIGGSISIAAGRTLTVASLQPALAQNPGAYTAAVIITYDVTGGETGKRVSSDTSFQVLQKESTPVRSSGNDNDDSGSSTQTNVGITTSDPKKGQVNSVYGIITGANNASGGGYSHWHEELISPDNPAADSRWKLQYADGTWAAGSMETGAGGIVYEKLLWELINGRWYAFGADGYLITGLFYDAFYGGWFYVDVNEGMKTGWVLIGQYWYYFNETSGNGEPLGIMYAGRRSPDGYMLKEDGAWDEESPY